MNWLISPAYAADVAPSGGGLDLLIMLAVFGLIFYFILYRPQAKRVKEHKNLVSSLSKGDEVLTQGGIVGRINQVAEDKEFIVLELNETSEVVVQKTAISVVLPKGTIKSLL